MQALSIKARLYLNLGILAVALTAVCGIGLSAFNSTSQRMRSMYDDNLLSIAQIDEVYQRSLQSQQYRLEAYVHRDLSFTQTNYEAVKANRARINELMEQFDRVQLGDDERALVAEIKSQREALVSIGKREIDALLASDFEAATEIRIGEIEPIIDRMDATSEKLAEARRVAAESLIVASEAEVRRDRWMILGSLLAALAIAAWSAWQLTRHIASGLARAEALAQKVSKGELGNRIEIEGNDEIDAVLRSLKSMDERLLDTVRQLSDSTGEVDRAAQSLSAGSDDLNQRTQEQAAALEETASSMEEMTATVKQNADNAKLANQIANSTRTQADQGGSVVQQAVSAMGEITTSSRRIEDIIGVIDEIAFQTNLLALNAAVEAARAGEQGRGFAVVAGEVRNLAQRSAGAAKEIKSLIGDSVDKVGVGATLVDHSGKTLAEIVNGVKKVTDVVGEMAAATAEQSAGIDQINLAIANMDAVTQQNAALFEETAAAAKSMQQQAERLRQLVAFFSFADAPRTAPVVVTPAGAKATAKVRSLRTVPRTAASATVARVRPAVKQAAGDAAWTEF